jgi:hypothetical protein
MAEEEKLLTPEEIREAEEIRKQLPRCPYCRKQPAEFRSAMYGLMNLTVLVVYCRNPHCLKILEILQVGAAAGSAPGQDNLIVPAGGLLKKV